MSRTHIDIVGAYIAADLEEKEEERIQVPYLLRDDFLQIGLTDERSEVEGTIILSAVTFPRPPRPIETETHLPSSSEAHARSYAQGPFGERAVGGVFMPPSRAGAITFATRSAKPALPYGN